MLRLVYLILVSLPFVLFYIARCNYISAHKENYTETKRYSVAQRIIKIIQKNGHIDTEIFGLDNLPDDGGYVMYPNHQGKYDALGIISAHKKPCTFLIDRNRSALPLANEFTMLLDAKRLDKTDLRTQLDTILDISRQVKNGRRFIVFPEGGYKNTDLNNDVEDFLPGAFKCSVRSHTPIVPVALIDSYRVFGLNSLRKVKTQVHFLKPLYYDDYKNMSTKEIAQHVKGRIESVINAVRD